jgi:hypothetical protein
MFHRSTIAAAGPVLITETGMGASSSSSASSGITTIPGEARASSSSSSSTSGCGSGWPQRTAARSVVQKEARSGRCAAIQSNFCSNSAAAMEGPRVGGYDQGLASPTLPNDGAFTGKFLFLEGREKEAYVGEEDCFYPNQPHVSPLHNNDPPPSHHNDPPPSPATASPCGTT